MRASDTIEKNIYILRQRKRDRESESEGEVSEEKRREMSSYRGAHTEEEEIKLEGEKGGSEKKCESKSSVCVRKRETERER